MHICQSQFTPSLPSPLGIHALVFYVCVSISALQIRSSICHGAFVFCLVFLVPQAWSYWWQMLTGIQPTCSPQLGAHTSLVVWFPSHHSCLISMESHASPFLPACAPTPGRQVILRGMCYVHGSGESKSPAQAEWPMIPAQERDGRPHPLSWDTAGPICPEPSIRAERGSGFWAEVRKGVGRA